MQIESADCRFPFRHLIVNTYLIHNKISIFLDKEFCSGHFFLNKLKSERNCF